MPWRMIIDQANAAAESNGRFFNKTNPKQIGIGMLYHEHCQELLLLLFYYYYCCCYK